MDVGRGGSAERAGYLLEIELTDLSFRGELLLIPDFELLLEKLANAAGQASRKHASKRGPRGARSSPAFDLFIQTLFTAAWQRGGDWTNYRLADGQWTGTLLDALTILKPYLPSKLFPPGDRGRSIEHIKTKLRKHITKKGRTGV
jgi:hypothetical protein